MAHTLPHRATLAHGTRVDLDSPAVIQARQELAACFQLAAQNGLEEGICNHFSAMVPGHDRLFFVNPYGYAFSEITASRLLVCDLAGNVIDGDGVPEATAFYIHARLHLQQPRLKVAFHTHMPHATALCLLQGPPLLWLGQTALKFYGRTAVDEHYNGLALDDSEGDRIARVLGDADILFLKNHGVMVTGPSIAEA
jgi:ribulose-5-phosphate 4-epimerase/fuculose-1-phosphate aldolase